MKKDSLKKDIFRDIKGSLGRFIAIVAIIALGVAFFSGLKIAPEDMKLTADAYYDDYNLMDLRIVSNLGMTSDDLKEIQKISGVKDARGAYWIDAIAEDGDTEVVLRVHDYVKEDQINSARLIEGRFPERLDEAVIEVGNENLLKAKIGSKIKLSSGKKESLEEDLENTEFTIVGYIQSPYYLSFEKGSTNIGNGQLRDFIMIDQENFKMDVFTDIFAEVEDTKELNSYKEEYFNLIDPVEKDIKIIAKDRQKIRYDEIYDEAREELDEGRAEYETEKAKAQKELDKAAKEIEDGRAEIEDGERELKKNEDLFYSEINKGKREIRKAEAKLNDGQVEYENGLKKFNKENKKAQSEFKEAEADLKKAEDGIVLLKENIGKIENVLKNPELPKEEKEKLQLQLKELKGTLSSTQAQYNEGKKEYDKNLSKFNKEIKDAEVKLKAAEGELKSAKEGISSLETNISQIEQALKNPDLPQEEKVKLERELKQLKATLTETKTKYETGMKEYDKNLKKFNENKTQGQSQLDKAKADLNKAQEGIATLQANISKIEGIIKNPELPKEEKTKLQSQLEELKTTLVATQAQYNSGKKELANGREQLNLAEQELKDAKVKLDDSRALLERERSKLIDEENKGQRELEKARNELTQARIDLEEGEKEYKEEKQKAEEELDKALRKINKGERDLKKLEKAKWHVLNRKKHYSYVDYEQSADRIDALATVFPLFFALVAALVSLTTMTRMVDEQRINIGTLKALGYGKGDIAFKYIFYAFTATLTGAVLGIAVGYTVFPIIIFNAYGLMYAMPPVMLSFNFKLASIVTLAAVALTTLTAYAASSNELKENPASLMRPKAPKLGKTILLERIPLIWNRLNFSYKVTVRNLFRYKRRFFMTVFGIAGCTALILAGFGIRDSIQTVVDKQFGEILSYDMAVSLDEDGLKVLDRDRRIEEYKLVLSEGGKISIANEEKDISIVVPKDTKDLDKFIHLENRKTKKDIDINKGVVITEGMSRALGLKEGDTIGLTNSDDKKADVEIESIAENYTFNYIYMTSEKYRELFNEPIEYNEALAIVKEDFKAEEEIISKSLIENDGINNVSFISTNRDSLADTINSLNYVVILMTVTAGALAFVVLYNLTNINVSERIREIATIKVLGFYDNEVSAYIYRENIILTIIGTLTGLLIGIFLHRFIIQTVEMESLMLGLKLHRNSYIYASLLTVMFALIVNIVMHYKLKAVKMVESLKSVD